MSRSSAAQPTGEVRDVRLVEALSDRYLAYALSTIVSRSLPDVRDGLKPVHRRILYAMRELRLNPDQAYKKAARVVGDTMGQYHPHGDQSIYDAMVRLAQDFAQRYPLVDGQGNFGNIDGDSAAAMRYTEARMTAVAMALLEGIDENTVDFRPNYSGESEEPVVLPAAFPNLLANGAQGIAVGMATSIPPHNVGEICDALLHLIKHPKARIDKLVELIPGPDFPTGGELVDARETILEAYKTGRGAFRLRARWEVEKLKGGGYQIIVTEIPYQVQKGNLEKKIAELLETRKLVLLGDVHDESAAEVRLVLTPKSRNVEPEVLMESLFRQTDLEVRVGLNMNVLDKTNTPGVMDLRQVLQAFLDHRLEVLERRTRFRLEKIAARLEVLEGYLIVYLNIDEVIRIVREEDEPKEALMATFDLTEVQATAVLNMRLRALRKLEEEGIRKEHQDLSEEQKGLKALMKDEGRRWGVVAKQVQFIREEFGAKTELGRRRTVIGAPPADIVVPLEAVIEREPVTVLCSEKGWIRAMKGHAEESENGKPVAAPKYKEGDRGRFTLKAYTTDKLLVFATNGRFYTVGVDKLPGGRGFGDPIRLIVDLPKDEDIVTLLVHRPEQKLLVAASDGRGFVVPADEVLAQTKNGRQVLNLGSGVEAAVCRVVEGDSVAVVGDNRKLIIFPLEELPEMTRGRGVILQRYKDGGLADAKTFTLDDGLTWLQGAGRTRTETDLLSWIGKRSQAGRLAPRGFPKSNKFQ